MNAFVHHNRFKPVEHGLVMWYDLFEIVDMGTNNEHEIRLAEIEISPTWQDLRWMFVWNAPPPKIGKVAVWMDKDFVLKIPDREWHDLWSMKILAYGITMITAPRFEDEYPDGIKMWARLGQEPFVSLPGTGLPHPALEWTLIHTIEREQVEQYVNEIVCHQLRMVNHHEL